MKLLLLFLFITFTFGGPGPYDNSTYQSLFARSKLELLTNAIDEDTTPADWPSTFQLSELFLERMDRSFDFRGDDLPKQGPFDLETRKKLVHSVGCVVKIEFVAVNNNYSGVFKGCKNALLRFSLAQQMDPSGGDSAITPGIALKFLRNYQPSANMMAMYSLVGQRSFNFFAHDLTNHVPELPSDGPLALQALRRKFSSASDYPAFVGLSDLAKYDENGTPASKVSFPFRLHFHPNTTLHYSIPDTYTGMTTEYQLSKLLTPNHHLYDVYAQATPFSDQLTLIGRIYTRSYATTSYFGDKTLFFQHTRFESDLVYYPSWAQKAKDILSIQRNVKTPGFHYADLPWTK